MYKKKVIIGLSGGVDSAVSAYLLKQQGYEVLGLFMRNWEDDGECPAAIDFEDVAAICQILKIPYYTVNFTREYQDLVFKEFLSESLAGRTPNPDILCNREIKFKMFFHKAKELGADYLATGHYCQIREDEQHMRLIKGADGNKDQTYFLYTIDESILKEVLFPIGHLPKTEVRKIAKEAQLPVATKKDSTGICFIGKRDFKEFLSQHLSNQPGDFMTLDGRIVGKHDGLAFYTIGQRKGLAIGGKGAAWFVVGKDVARNIVFVEQGEEHPALFSRDLAASQVHWIAGEIPGPLPFQCMAKIRYRQPEQACEILSDGPQLRVRFSKPQRAVTPGQSIVFYQEDVCLGGAVIDNANRLPSKLQTD